MDPDMQPFDMHRIFFGSLSWVFLLEIIFRTCVMYVVAVAASIVIGKRGMGDLTPFEYIVVIAMGSTTGTPMMEVNIPILHGSMVLVTVVTVDTLVAQFTRRSVKLERFLNTEPTLLIRDGAVVHKAIEREKMGKDELLMLLRSQGVRNIAEVEIAFLEPSGALSLFLKGDLAKPELDGESTIPHDLLTA